MKKILLSIFTVFLVLFIKVSSVNAEVFRDQWYAMDGNTSDFQVFPFTGFGRSSMLIDQNDNPHFAWSYIEENGITNYIYYIYWNGTDWVNESGNAGDPVNDPEFGMVAQKDFYYYVSMLELDGVINLYISNNTGGLDHYSRTLNTPFSEQESIESTYFFGGLYNLHIDPNAVLHELTWDMIHKNRYINNRTGNWNDYLFDIDQELSISTDICGSVKLDSAGNPHFVCSGFEGANKIIYFITDHDSSLENENFVVETVYTAQAPVLYINHPSLSFDSEDNPLVAWVDRSWTQDYNKINYLKKSQTWNPSEIEEVYSIDGYFYEIEYLCLEYGSDGNANLAWIQQRDTSPEGMVPDGDIMFAHNDTVGGEFSYEIIKENAFDVVTGDPERQTRQVHLNLDKNGAPFVGWSEHMEGGESIYMAMQLSQEDETNYYNTDEIVTGGFEIEDENSIQEEDLPETGRDSTFFSILFFAVLIIMTALKSKIHFCLN